MHNQSAASSRSDALVLFTLAKQRAQNVHRTCTESAGEDCREVWVLAWIGLFMHAQLTIQFIRLDVGCASSSPRLALAFDFMQTKRAEKSRAAFNALEWAGMKQKPKKGRKKPTQRNRTRRRQSKFDCALFCKRVNTNCRHTFRRRLGAPFKAQLSFMANLWNA